MGHGNENLKWQLTDQYNLGTEISAWNNRLTFSFDYYLKKTVAADWILEGRTYLKKKGEE